MWLPVFVSLSFIYPYVFQYPAFSLWFIIFTYL